MIARVNVAAMAFAMAAAAVPALADTLKITVKGLAFQPAEATAHVGDTVEWDNEDFVAHTATARDQQWDVQLPAHNSGSTVLSKAGSVEYFCRLHPNMKGKITIEAR